MKLVKGWTFKGSLWSGRRAWRWKQQQQTGDRMLQENWSKQRRKRRRRAQALSSRLRKQRFAWSSVIMTLWVIGLEVRWQTWTSCHCVLRLNRSSASTPCWRSMKRSWRRWTPGTSRSLTWLTKQEGKPAEYSAMLVQWQLLQFHVSSLCF